MEMEVTEVSVLDKHEAWVPGGALGHQLEPLVVEEVAVAESVVLAEVWGLGLGDQ